MEVIALVVLALFFVMLLKVSGKTRQERLLQYLPGPPGYLVVGNALDFIGHRQKQMMVMLDWDRKYGPMYKSWIGSTPFVHLSSAEHIEVILSSSTHIQKGANNKFLVPWLGAGLLTSTGIKYLNRRKMISPAFHFKILEGFLEVFHVNCNTLIRRLESAVTEEKQSFDIHPFITLCTLDIICETAMGVKMNAQIQENSTYVQALKSVTSLTTERINKFWLHSDFIFTKTKSGRDYYKSLKILHDNTETILRERIKKVQENGRKEKKTFLDLLLDVKDESGNKMAFEAIKEEVNTLMFEGHGTTAAGICWALFLLGHNPQIQEEVYKELKAIFCEDPGRQATMHDLLKMKYLGRVIKESLRLFPPVSFISRQLQEDVKIGDDVIPYGTTVYLHLYTLHRNQKTFPNPEQFNPDHFLSKRTQARHPYAYLPFSAGQRNCIGETTTPTGTKLTKAVIAGHKFALAEEKIILSSILRKFKVESLERREDLTLVNELVLRPDSGIRLRLAKRNVAENI